MARQHLHYTFKIHSGEYRTMLYNAGSIPDSARRQSNIKKLQRSKSGGHEKISSLDYENRARGMRCHSVTHTS
jgi:hypothetical protein